MIIMAGFCFMRTIICVFQVVLYTQRRDRLRFGAIDDPGAGQTRACWPSWSGWVSARSPPRTATTAADAILLAIFAVALYWKRSRWRPNDQGRFLLSKDPVLEHGGDIELSRLVDAAGRGELRRVGDLPLRRRAAPPTPTSSPAGCR